MVLFRVVLEIFRKIKWLALVWHIVTIDEPILILYY